MEPGHMHVRGEVSKELGQAEGLADEPVPDCGRALKGDNRALGRKSRHRVAPAGGALDSHLSMDESGLSLSPYPEGRVFYGHFFGERILWLLSASKRWAFQ